MKKHLKNNPSKPTNRKSSFLLIPLVFLYFTLSPLAQAVVPAPDGGYPGGNTAEGQNALFSLTNGTYNTAVGVFSLWSNTEGNFNTGIGAGALLTNTADRNTAIGAGALLSNTAGNFNTANGAFALFTNTEGGFNTANGEGALYYTHVTRTLSDRRALADVAVRARVLCRPRVDQCSSFDFLPRLRNRRPGWCGRPSGTLRADVFVPHWEGHVKSRRFSELDSGVNPFQLVGSNGRGALIGIPTVHVVGCALDAPTTRQSPRCDLSGGFSETGGGMGVSITSFHQFAIDFKIRLLIRPSL